ncbi:MAG: ribonuclease H-like domain-containing protein [Gammaproteobacteria bacterium]|nr:ribonuclease H-like domain-containing protein [Gammaproteobacteria bacterium]
MGLRHLEFLAVALLLLLTLVNSVILMTFPSKKEGSQTILDSIIAGEKVMKILHEHPFDIETIPEPGSYGEFLEEASNNFKAPSGLTKKQACADMGVDDQGPDYKYKSKDECISIWEERFAAIKAPEVAEQNWRKTGLSGLRGEVICIGCMVEPGVVSMFSRSLKHSEGDLLQDYFDFMAKTYNGRTPKFVGHNIANFDLQFIYHRSVINGVKPSVKLPFHGRHDKDYYDNMIAWTGHISKFISQDELAKALGLPGKPDNIDGSQVWDYVAEGNEQAVFDYCADDVIQLFEIYKRLTFADQAAQVNDVASM